MKLITDFLDKGALRNNELPTVTNYITLIISAGALISGFSKAMLDILVHYSGEFPLLVKLIPLFVMITITILSFYAFTRKRLVESRIYYSYSNLVRQCAKIFAVLSLCALVFNLNSIFQQFKPVKQPVIVFFCTMKGEPIGNLDVRIMDSQKKDITEGFAQTDTEKGMVMLTSEKTIDMGCFLCIAPNGKQQFIPLNELQKLDSLVFGLSAYQVILPTK